MNEKFQHIEIALIDEDVDNHRLIHDSVDDLQLQASIAEQGVQQPVKVCAKEGGRYTLVFGFRRKKASLAAGLTTIPAMVVEGLGAAEIRALQAIENLERKELHPLEEAQFCQDLAEQFDAEVSVEASAEAFVAAKVGRSVKWVENRLALARLSERVRQGFLAGDITLGHAKLIAQLAGHEAQEEVFGRVKANTDVFYADFPDDYDPTELYDDDDELDMSKLAAAPEAVRRAFAEVRRPPATISDTRRLVEQRLRRLNDASWLLDQPFDGKPACTECPHNSHNQPGLFDGDRPAEPTCLNAPCHEEKRKFTMRAIQRATNTAVKNGAKPTVAGVQGAIAEREVTFVKPDEVAAKVKFAMKPAAAKKATKAERRGEDNWERNHKIDNEFRERMRKWLAKFTKAVHAKIPVDPITSAMLALVNAADLQRDCEAGSKKAKAAAQATFRKVIPLLLKPTQKGLAEVAELLAPQLPDRFLTLVPLWYDNPPANNIIREVLGVEDVGEKPDRKAIERELFPDTAKAEPKKGKPKATKKASKKKATA